MFRANYKAKTNLALCVSVHLCNKTLEPKELNKFKLNNSVWRISFGLPRQKARRGKEHKQSLRGTKWRGNPEKRIKILMKQGYVYILFNKRNGTLYTGVTSDIVKRIYEHKNKLVDGFSKKYEVDKLGYYEIFDDITQAIEREKQIKSGTRKKKLDLIESINPNWQDLYYKII